MIRKTLCLLLALLALTIPALAEETDDAPIDPRVQPAVAISFDDGPSEFTQQVLDVLAENDCHATFFMVGTSMEKMPEVVKAVYDAGNEVGLHTWRHNDLTQMNADAIVRNLQLCQNIVLEQTGTTARWLRPPYGKVGPGTYGACNALGMYIATWTIDSRDWETQLRNILPQIVEKGYQVLTVDQLMSFRESLKSATHYYHLDMNKLRPLE